MCLFANISGVCNSAITETSIEPTGSRGQELGGGEGVRGQGESSSSEQKAILIVLLDACSYLKRQYLESLFIVLFSFSNSSAK